jgi:hypothetical protein
MWHFIDKRLSESQMPGAARRRILGRQCNFQCNSSTAPPGRNTVTFFDGTPHLIKSNRYARLFGRIVSLVPLQLGQTHHQ